MDPAIVDNDLEAPIITEERQRPALDFVPASAKRPTSIKKVEKRENQAEKKAASSISPSKRRSSIGQFTRTDTTVPARLDSAVEVVAGQSIRGSIQEEDDEDDLAAGKDLKEVYTKGESPMDRIDRMIETQSIHQISEKGIDDVRKSRDLLRKTPALV